MAEVLPIVIYSLLIVLILVAIIIGIKLIVTLDKVNNLLEDVTMKVKSLDKVFEIINFTTGKMTFISESIFGFLTSVTKKIFSLRKSKEEDENE